MAGFSARKEVIDSSTCGAMLLFSTLLTLHVLADGARGEDRDRDSNRLDAVDRLQRCFKLISFARNLLLKEWEEDIRNSGLSAILQSPQPQLLYPVAKECQRLSELPANSDLSFASAQTYNAGIERLQYAFSRTGAPSKSHCTIRSALLWPMQLQDDFLVLLDARRPEALIILAYYGVVLNSFRDSWMVHRSGVSLIHGISASVGKYWEPWLAWPKHVIHSSTVTTPA